MSNPPEIPSQGISGRCGPPLQASLPFEQVGPLLERKGGLMEETGLAVGSAVERQGTHVYTA
jgi:hypothetical protein